MCDRVRVIVGRYNGSAPAFLNEEKDHASQGAPHAVRILSSRRRPVRLSGLYCHGRPAAPSPPAYALPWERQPLVAALRSEEHTSELQSLMRNSYADFCLKKKQKDTTNALMHVSALDTSNTTADYLTKTERLIKTLKT